MLAIGPGTASNMQSTHRAEGSSRDPGSAVPATQRRWPALDGLRGLAILMVFGYHLPWGAFRTGSYGVILFFVLSGFLITTILLKELERDGRVNLRHFYGRRARRLLPALLVLSLGHLLLQLTVLGEPERWWERTWPVLAYVSNLVQASGTSLVHMGHTWSLAVEEHFYLLWPVVLIFLPRRWRLGVTLGLAIGLMVWRLQLLMAGAPDLRILFGTDSNAFAPLLGCALAIGHHEGRIPKPPKDLSAISIAVLVVVACIPADFTDRRVLWGSLPVALLSVIAIHAALHQPVFWLEHRVLRWFGMISYSLYLWHYMLISLPWERLPIAPLLGMVVSSIGAAFISWRFIEAPILGSEWRLPSITNSPRPALAARPETQTIKTG